MMLCVVLCSASVVVGYDRKRSGLRNAAINREYDNYSWHRDLAITLSIALKYSRTSWKRAPAPSLECAPLPPQC